MTSARHQHPQSIATVEQLEGFRLRTELALPNGCRPIGFDEQVSWNWQDGVLTHVSGGYFHVVGVQRKEPKAERLMMYQPQSALTGLLLHTKGDKLPWVLLQARAEPGNVPVVQYGPTIQSTQANYTRVHGGKPTAYLDYFFKYHPNGCLLRHSTQLDLGGRYYQKIKTHHYVTATTLPEAVDHFVWAPLDALLPALQRDNLLNPDLRSLLAVFDWEAQLGDPTSQHAVGGLQTLHELMQRAEQKSRPCWQLVPVSALASWKLTSDRLAPTSGKGLGVQMFEVTAGTREVTKWSQPLLTATSHGHVQQLLRRGRHGTEWLVTVDTEDDIGAVAIVNASGVSYPGDGLLVGSVQEAGQRYRCVMQCDEGGRFHQTVSCYEVRWVESGDVTPLPNQCWVNTSAIKQLLASSNRCAIQFRCVASLLLDELNPCLATLR